MSHTQTSAAQFISLSSATCVTTASLHEHVNDASKASIRQTHFEMGACVVARFLELGNLERGGVGEGESVHMESNTHRWRERVSIPYGLKVG